MNLTTDAWIPTVRMDGKPEMVSLLDAFHRGHELRDLAVRPHERIALMRLLICVAQAALDGPADFDVWEACCPRIAPAALEYLKHWQPAFELFGDGQRFLQVANLKKAAGKVDEADEEGSSSSKLDLALATGNNTTLFDNAGGSSRGFDEARLALNLVTFQCFAPCGTIGVALWNGTPTLGWNSYPEAKPGKSSHAPCLSGNLLHSYLRGSNLLDSLHSNLVAKEQVGKFCGPDAWGMPIWERMPSSAVDEGAARNASHSYLGRLVPLSRAIRLTADRQTMTLANGLEYPAYPEWREASATIVTRPRKNQPTRVTLAASADRGVWRELNALTVLGVGRDSVGGPVALRNVADEVAFDLWVGGLIAKGNGKLVDTTESVFHVPAAMLTDGGQRLYEDGVRLAGDWARRLRWAIFVYHQKRADNAEHAVVPEQCGRMQGNAEAQFWTDIEQDVALLLEVVAAPESLGLPAEWHRTPWGRSVRRAAQAAYESACPHETPRQIRAYVLGRRALFAAPVEEPVARTRKGAEE